MLRHSASQVFGSKHPALSARENDGIGRPPWKSVVGTEPASQIRQHISRCLIFKLSISAVLLSRADRNTDADLGSGSGSGYSATTASRSYAAEFRDVDAFYFNFDNCDNGRL
ncbi:hypothetical protein F4811DRAFT_551184 [Daldinia bambusicola]|nr:hypothetical protein F4811DRAFT_551184 [Daldinia bambusicola]